MKVTKAQAVRLFLACGVATAEKWNLVRLQAMIGKLTDIVTPETKIDDEATNNLLTEVLAAIAATTPIEVVEDAAPATTDAAPEVDVTAVPDTTAKAPVPKKVKPGQGEAAVKEAQEAAATTEEAAATESKTDVKDAVIKAAKEPKPPKEPKAPKEPKPPKAPKEPKPPKEPKAPKEPKPPKEAKPEKALAAWEHGAPGVRPSEKNRHFIAGLLYKKHGLEVGITDELIAEMDAIYGRSNPEQTKCDLGRSWHVINAFLNGQDLLDSMDKPASTAAPATSAATAPAAAPEIAVESAPADEAADDTPPVPTTEGWTDVE